MGGPLGWVDLLIVSQVEADEDGEGVDLGEADEKPRVVVVVLGERLAEEGGEGGEDGNSVARQKYPDDGPERAHTGRSGYAARHATSSRLTRRGSRCTTCGEGLAHDELDWP